MPAMCNATSFQLLLRILNLRRYNGRILFVPAPGYEEVGDPVDQATGYETNGFSTGFQDDGRTGSNGETCGYVGPSIKEAEAGLRWRSLNGPFVSVWLGNVPFASEDAMAAPKAEASLSPFSVHILAGHPFGGGCMKANVQCSIA
jgi:sphingosine kinase